MLSVLYFVEGELWRDEQEHGHEVGRGEASLRRTIAVLEVLRSQSKRYAHLCMLSRHCIHAYKCQFLPELMFFLITSHCVIHLSLGLPRGIFPPTFIVVISCRPFSLHGRTTNGVSEWHVVISFTIASLLNFLFPIPSFRVSPRSIHAFVSILIRVTAAPVGACTSCSAALCRQRSCQPPWRG